ncbi:FkbM family methyltransferase, partial [Rubrivirga sp.]|uniref:FkbM family methyltransferase n=1 Tax=Rubrivirga sp. TaxID=1885344 RepID=UPI003C78395D
VRHNARLNGFDIDVLEAAVGGEVGSAWLRTDKGGPVTYRIDPGHEGAGLEVDVTTVDAMVENGFPPPDLVKVDVEGVEVAVLHGMARTLAEHRPSVLVEVHHAVADFPDAVDAIATPLGYRATVLEGGPMPSGGVRAHVALDPA